MIRDMRSTFRRRALVLSAALTALSAAPALAAAPSPGESREISVPSADGTLVTGQADLPSASGAAVVVMVPDSNVVDRDGRFPHAPVYLDLSRRMVERGLATVRYDRRGGRYGAPWGEDVDPAVSATATSETMRDDLAAIYAWARADEGLGARCVILLGQGEGLVHIGRLAASGAPAPQGVIGVGGNLESPVSVVRWQMAERDAYSIRMMDADGDGRTTNEEVLANFARTPSSVAGERAIRAFLRPADRPWTERDIAAAQGVRETAYRVARFAARFIPDDLPYPDRARPMASFAWEKSWFTDDTPVARNLARWDAPMIFHNGALDSQVNYERQVAAGEPLLGGRATFVKHEGVGHTLGPDVLWAPMDDAAADRIADDAAALAAACQG